MIRFETLLEKVRSYSPEADLELLRRAYVFSALEHKGQVRHSGEPYLVHPLEVADVLADMKLDVVAVAAGLLHDVVEDTLTTPERIAELFGPEIAHVVEGVTKIGAIPFSSSEERQAENFRKMLLAMVDDIRVILVKLADRLHNMARSSIFRAARKIAQETLDCADRHRLGMKGENESELSFRPAGAYEGEAPREGRSQAEDGGRHDPQSPGRFARSSTTRRSRSRSSMAGLSASTAFISSSNARRSTWIACTTSSRCASSRSR
jgi:GTP pyrophosphokinase